VRKDGQIIRANLSLSTVRGPDGRPTHLISIIQDITESKRAEEELARTNAELEKFVLVASHDLQEPLRTTANAAMLLEEQHAGKLDGDAKELLGFVVSGVMHMRRLIDSLLIFAGIGAKPAVATATDSRAVLTDVLSHLRAAIAESGAVVDCGPLPIVRIDPAQLDQVFMNLISNAVKFRGDTALRIRVEAHRDNQDWVISVADNGIGINPAYFGKIFEIFERLNARYPGTGVGLAICKKIVEGNNGRIWVESEEGKGARVSFTVAAVDIDKEAGCPTVQSL
jgi:light-regulated signal transduction histidine kinase (bacteriophytochrome)